MRSTGNHKFGLLLKNPVALQFYCEHTPFFDMYLYRPLFSV